MATLCAVPQTSVIGFCHFRHWDSAPHTQKSACPAPLFLTNFVGGRTHTTYGSCNVNHPDSCTASNSVKEGGGASLRVQFWERKGDLHGCASRLRAKGETCRLCKLYFLLLLLVLLLVQILTWYFVVSVFVPLPDLFQLVHDFVFCHNFRQFTTVCSA